MGRVVIVVLVVEWGYVIVVKVFGLNIIFYGVMDLLLL